MITLKKLDLSFGPKTIFDSISVSINAGDKIALVGSNGAGKSTLLKVLAGLEKVDAGEIVLPTYATVGYLPQDILNASPLSLFKEVESAFVDIISTREHIEELSKSLHSLNSSSDEYKQALETIGELEHKLEDADSEKLKSKIETVLHGLGFSQKDMQRPCVEFSGGWQMRIALAKLLLLSPTLLMLDEPTNHLDIDSVIWLEEYLSAYKASVIIVSHDRRFIDALANRTFALSLGSLKSYEGNYSFYLRESQARKLQLQEQAKNQAKEIEKTERFIERFRAKNTKAAQVQSRIKALEKIEKIEIEDDESNISFRFPEPERCGQVVLKVENLSKSYGANSVLKDVSFNIERGERIAIVGVNGAGKSTLVRILANALDFDNGKVELGYNVEMSYFAQHQAQDLDRNNSVLDEAYNAATMDQKPRTRQLLGSFLFRGDDVFKKVAVLSGGEKNRLALAKMLLKSFNFLILDEPTNHLDMNSKNVLQKAIKAYKGTLVIVSHDRDFIDPLVDKVVEVKDSSIRTFIGNVSDYAEKIKEERKGVLTESAKKSKPAFTSKERRIQTAMMNQKISPLKKAVEKLEKDIAMYEEEYASLEGMMTDTAMYKNKNDSVTIMKRYATLKEIIEHSYKDWERLNLEIEEIKNE